MKMPAMTTKSINGAMLIGFIGFLVLLVGAIGAGWYYILKMSDTVNKYNTEIYTVQAQTEKLSELSWRYQRVLPKRDLVLETIPAGKDESTFMADMESLAGRDNLVITGSSVGNSLTKGSKSGAFSQTVSKDNYYELPIRYEMSGTYGNFVKLVSDLSTLRRLSSVNDVSVNADLSDKSVLGRVKVVFVVTIYAKE